ncbi:hypothetical protein ACGFNU_21075 [Spirillospora sp. NPDC048911]|uniref:hypothetical protein n=1 Tax=Spirillospora sp. NPDC048911 TaxID=3364527 RepID=UPI003715EDC5
MMPTLPSFSSAASVLAVAQPYLIGCAATLLVVLFVVAGVRVTKPRRSKAKAPGQVENRLTFLVAVIAAGVAAQGMWRFFRDVLDFAPQWRIVAFAVLELVTFTCALRARRNIREAEKPEDAKAGIDGVAVWVVTALSGTFSAMDAESIPEMLFRLVMPLLAAWLWERGMSIERQRIRKKHNNEPKINLRVTPERVLVWLRIAEPSGRTASEVDAHRRLTKVAKAAARVRALRSAWDVKGVRLHSAQRRLDRAMRSAVAHAGLAADSERQRALIAQLGSMYNAGSLAELTPDAPWSDLTQPPTRTVFESLGVSFVPVQYPPRQVPAEPGREMTDGSQTRSADQSPSGSGSGSSSGSDDQARDQSDTRSENPKPDQSDDQVPDQVPTKPQTRKTQTGPRTAKTGPKKSARAKAKPKALDRIDEARAVDKAYLDEHGRHIPAEKLARALGIAKPAALQLVKQIRGGHIDIAK